jgi:hypothetical protein
VIPALLLILVPGPPPVLLCAKPLTLEPGRANKVVVRGRNLDSVFAAIAQDPKSQAAISGKPQKKPVGNNEPAEKLGDMELELSITPAKETPGGTLGLTLRGLGGESGSVRFAVAEKSATTAEVEPNDSYAKAQFINIGTVVNGQFSKNQDVDVYRIKATPGERLQIAIEAAALASPADCILTITDSAGRVLAIADDTDGKADPSITITAPAGGELLVTVQEASDLGGAYYHYRMQILSVPAVAKP